MHVPSPGHGSAYRPSLTDRPWVPYYSQKVPSSLTYPPIGVHELLEASGGKHPDRPACTLFGKATTYGQLVSRSHRLAGGLAALGAGPGRRVGMLLPNSPDYIVAMHAAWLTGATVLQLSPLMVAEEISRWLEMTDCHIVVTLDLFVPAVVPSLQQGPLEHMIVTSLAERMNLWRGWLYHLERLRRRGPIRVRDEANVHRFDHMLRQTTNHVRSRFNPEEEVALLVPTGGTTASPKAVMLTHRNLVANALQLHSWSTDRNSDPSGILGILPFFHAYGLSVCLLAGLVNGATVHLHPRFEANTVLDLLEEHRIELVPAVPAMLAALNRSLRERPRDLSFIRAVFSGASALDGRVREEFQKAGVQMIAEGYGLTEASPVTHVNPFNENNRPGTIGIPLPDTEARIMDQATGLEELPDGAVGELVVRGPQVMKGYFGNPAETGRVLRDGWLFTGDLARRDRDGFFTIVDRKKDIIKTSGFLVYPAEVEEVLRGHPDVAEAAVIGVPDADCGERVRAMIVPRAGVSLDRTTLRRYCEEHLGKHKRPGDIEIVAELPKNFLGKVQRRRLREAASNSSAGS